jgi:predicted  nucleic acid-binding Zn-ribbon protein
MSGDRAAEAKRLTEQAVKLREEIRAMEGDAPAKAAAAAALKEKEAAAAAAAAAAKAASDEKELSENMKAKLRKELISQGADPNRSSGNGILIVAGESCAVCLCIVYNS